MSHYTKKYSESTLHKLTGKILLNHSKRSDSTSVDDDYDFTTRYTITPNKCLLLALMIKVWIIDFTVMGSNDAESLGKPSMLHNMGVICGE